MICPVSFWLFLISLPGVEYIVTTPHLLVMSHPDFVYSVVVATEDLVSGEPEERSEAEVPGVHAELRHRVSWPTLGEVTCEL